MKIRDSRRFRAVFGSIGEPFVTLDTVCNRRFRGLFSAPKTGNSNARGTIPLQSLQHSIAVVHPCLISADVKHGVQGECVSPFEVLGLLFNAIREDIQEAIRE